jgi:hypothetical protein
VAAVIQTLERSEHHSCEFNFDWRCVEKHLSEGSPLFDDLRKDAASPQSQLH